MSHEILKSTAKQAVQHATDDTAYLLLGAIKNWFALVLAGMGLTVSVNEYIGGLFFALAGAAIARRREPGASRGLAVYAGFTAAILSTLAAVAIQYLEYEIPLVLVMGPVGFFSRTIVAVFARIGSRVEERQDEIIDQVIDRVVPGRDD